MRLRTGQRILQRYIIAHILNEIVDILTAVTPHIPQNIEEQEHAWTQFYNRHYFLKLFVLTAIVLGFEVECSAPNLQVALDKPDNSFNFIQCVAN